MLAMVFFTAVSQPQADASAGRVDTDDTKLSDSERLQKLFNDRWEYSMREFPEFATLVGDRRYNGQWTDYSNRAIERRREQDIAAMALLEAIDPSALSPEQALNHELLRFELDDLIEGAHFFASQTFPGAHDYSNIIAPITPMGGVQQRILRFISMMPAERVADYEDILTRLRGVSNLVDQTMALMLIGLEKGMSPPRVTLRNVADQIDGFVIDDPLASPLLAAFTRFPEDVHSKDRKRLRDEAVQIFEKKVSPAFSRLHEFFVAEYLPATRETISAAAMPDGKRIYEYRVRHFTTTDLTPAEIHKIGMAEVDRIRTEMQQLMQSVGFKGSIEAFGEHLSRDSGHPYSKAEDLLAGYRNIAKRADLEALKLFRTLPRIPYEITAMPSAHERTFAAAYYQPGSLAAGRSAEFVVNTYDLDSRPRWEMEALLLHEAVPGHHTQVALARELEGVPLLRRHQWPVAFGEGWALYAETLGYQMGFYTEPASRFGQLSSEMWRAVRIAVDTGIHSQDWSRDQAIQFFRRNTGKNEREAIVEVDRYIVWPGHALAYKIGQLEIKQLRAQAERALGKAFDLRTFHDQVLKNGAVPLALLRRQIHVWIELKRLGASDPEMSISAESMEN